MGPYRIHRRRSAVQRRRRQGCLHRGRQIGDAIGIGRQPVALPESQFGCLDQPMDMGEAVRFSDIEPVEHAEDHQRRKTLGRRRQVEQRTGGMLDLEGHDAAGAVGRQILPGNRRTGAGQIRRDGAGQGAAVKAVKAAAHQPTQGLRQGRLAKHCTFLGRRAGHQHRLRKARHVAQFGELRGRQSRLALGDDNPLVRVGYGVRKKPIEGQSAAPCQIVLQGLRPARNGAGDGIGGQRSPCRNGLAASVEHRRHSGARRATGIDADGRRPRLMDQPEPVAAEPGHVRVHHGDGRRHGDHRLDRSSTVGQHLGAALRRSPVRSHDDATAI